MKIAKYQRTNNTTSDPAGGNFIGQANLGFTTY